MTTTITPQHEALSALIPIAAAAQELGRSRRTIDRWRKRGILPAKRLGGRVVVLREDLDHLLANLPPA